MTALLVLAGILIAAGACATVVVARRLQVEIAEMLAAFAGFERAATPALVTVRSDRDRLAARLAVDTGDDVTRR